MYIFLFIALYFEVFLLITFFEKKDIDTTPHHTQKKKNTYPTVAIAVPCFNGNHATVTTIESLLSLDYPPEKLSVIIIDDGSTDNSWELLQQFATDTRVTLVQHSTNQGKHAGLNTALNITSAEIFGGLDADSFVAPSALKEIVTEFEKNPEIQAVIPAIRINNPQTILEKIQHAEYSLSIFIRKVFTYIDGNFVTPGPFTLFKREVFEKIGEYKEAHNTEDMEMALRMQSNYMKIGNAPKAHVFTNAPSNYRSLFKQRVRWTYGFLRNFFDYRFMVFSPRYGNIGLFILPISFLSIFSALFFTVSLGVSLAYQAVDTYTQISIMGLQTPSFDINLFYINTSAVLWITIALIALAFVFIIIGKRLVNDKNYISLDIVLYLALYGFIAPWWLAKSVVDATRGKRSSWSKEITKRV